MRIKEHLQEFLDNFPTRHLAAIVLLILASCANPVSPTGGPRDTNPPLILHSEPENASVNFDADEIRLFFNEFIQVKGLSQQFLSSPPFENVPETRIRGKSMIIKLSEGLRENTTYTLFFGDAISDFNEGNAIPNYRFVFSTGPILDSMELKGRVINAQTLAPEKDVFVLLYDNYEDSIPMLERPYYISRTNDKGDFTFTNLQDIPYKIFALRDVNANLIYDLPNEEIAFLAENVHPHAPVKPKKTETTTENDTLVLDESENMLEMDTTPSHFYENEHEGHHSGEEAEVISDSLKQEEKDKTLVLYLFNEVDSTQRLEHANYLHPNRLQFVFRFPVRDLTINAMPAFEDDWKIPEMSSKADTLVYWLLDVDRDSLMLELSAAKMKTDTVRLSLKPLHTYREGKLADTALIWLDVKSNVPRSGPYDIYKPIKLTFSEPLATVNTERIVLLEDSVRVEPEIKFMNELQRVLIINHPWKDTTNYDLLIPDSVFIGIYVHSNDTLLKRFKTRMLSDYGNLTLNIEHSFNEGQFIVELLDTKGKVLKQRMSGLDQEKLAFLYLLPGNNYKVKLIHDSNANGKWDTGVYLKSKQPEKVYIFDKAIEMRANWDIEETIAFPGN